MFACFYQHHFLCRFCRNMSVEIAQIVDLKPGDGDRPIDIKVLRSWISYGKRSECCFLLIDKQVISQTIIIQLPTSYSYLLLQRFNATFSFLGKCNSGLCKLK